jgi:hypothetical protein
VQGAAGKDGKKQNTGSQVRTRNAVVSYHTCCHLEG